MNKPGRILNKNDSRNRAADGAGRMKTIIIDSERQKTFCQTMLSEIKPDGSKTVVVKNTDNSPTARQQRLEWKWYGEISVSGLGQDDDKDSVHIRAKWQFARPILLENDEYFDIIYTAFIKTVKGSENYSKCCRVFADQYIHTSLLPKNLKALYLREFQMFWTGKGANLTDPSMQGVDLDKYSKKRK